LLNRWTMVTMKIRRLPPSNDHRVRPNPLVYPHLTRGLSRTKAKGCRPTARARSQRRDAYGLS
jgi:hypothetical protein